MIYELKEICTPLKGTQIDTSLLSDKNPYKYINGGTKESGYHIEANTLGNTVIVSEGGASCGYVNFIDTDFWCGCHCYKLTEPKVNAKFLYYALKANQDKIMELRTGAAMPNIKKSTFIHFKLDITNDEKLQKTIVSELDKIQDALANKNEQLKKLDELIQSKFYEMFGDPVRNDKGWDVEKLGEIGTLKNGLNFSQNEEGYSVRLLGVSDFKNRFMIDDITELSSISLNQMPSDEFLLKDGDIVFVRSNGNKKLVGRSLLVYPGDEPTSFSGFCIRFRNCSNDIDNIYLVTCLKTESIREKLFGNGANISNLNQTMLQSLEIPRPPLSLQQAYTAYVKKVGQAKAIVNQEIAHLQELLDSRMDFYFRK